MEVLKVIILAVILICFVMLGLAAQILLKKGGKFPDTHIGANKYLKARGITCAQTFDKMEQAKASKEMRYKELKREKG
jgi:hypothetical protein